MDWWILELITVGALVAALLVLGPLIKRFGRSYAADVQPSRNRQTALGGPATRGVRSILGLSGRSRLLAWGRARPRTWNSGAS